ncbi:MAG: hypothetical protein HN390_03685 [Anaerolineae bacterium]|nr:hypothetical protein [Anaerolineae bacterium]MBT7189308.1 hypothetical protein [Anaerolineae bacterium]MBT7988762.1 hypothetical protein [Anaerolineae bacterium]
MDKKDVILWRTLFGGILLSSVLAILDLQNLAIDKGFPLTQPKWLLFSIGIAATGLLAALFLFLTWTKYFEKLKASYDAFLRYGEKLKWLVLIFFVASLAILPLLVLHPYLGGLIGNRLWIKIFIFFLLSFLCATFLRVVRIEFGSKNKTLTWAESLAFAALAQLLVYQLVIASLYITDYPFAIGWTRDSRYYYASLFFAKEIYGQNLPLPILHPTLHFIFSLPYLFGKLPIWVHRGWTIILTFGLTWAVVRVLSRKIHQQIYALLFSLWAFLFLIQGSIYAHLLVPSLIIFFFVSPKKIKRSWITIIIASAWAGMSRINWFPVPAMLAALIYFLEVPKKKSILQYLLLPAVWFATGIASAFLSQAIYIQLSGNGARNEFFTSLSSKLIWERLLPGNTYAPGILWGAVFLSAPLILLAISLRKKEWHPIRLWGIFSAIFVLFVGGSVVSVKIGGGADLHNMDAYFVSILLVGTTVLARGFRLDSFSKYPRGEMFFAATLVLAWFILRGGGSVEYDRGAVNASLNEIKTQVTSVAKAGDEVLFISQRHLLAIEEIEDIPLIPEYEKDVLMEMVMSRNTAYLGGFYHDLRNQRFGIIVIDPQTDTLLSEKRSFAAENNIWILKVARPLWCYYEPLVLYENVGVELYVPRAEAVEGCD